MYFYFYFNHSGYIVIDSSMYIRFLLCILRSKIFLFIINILQNTNIYKLIYIMLCEHINMKTDQTTSINSKLLESGKGEKRKAGRGPGLRLINKLDCTVL